MCLKFVLLYYLCVSVALSNYSAAAISSTLHIIILHHHIFSWQDRHTKYAKIYVLQPV